MYILTRIELSYYCQSETVIIFEWRYCQGDNLLKNFQREKYRQEGIVTYTLPRIQCTVMFLCTRQGDSAAHDSQPEATVAEGLRSAGQAELYYKAVSELGKLGHWIHGKSFQKGGSGL